MGLEVASFINDLNVANPVGGTDQKNQGDDHLRLIKATLKATFPLAVGARKFRDDDAGATDTLAWLLFRNSPTPAVGDQLASYAISGNNSAIAEKVYARFQGKILVPTAGIEEGTALIKTMIAGAETIVGSFGSDGVLFNYALVGSGRPPTCSIKSVVGAGTWTKPLAPMCRAIRLEMVAGGGAGGGVNGVAGTTAGAGSGGGPGRYGWSPLIIVPDATLTANFVVGAGGVGVSAATGGAGGNTTFTINAVTYTVNGGTGGQGCSMSSSTNQIIVGGSENGSTNMESGGSGCIGGRGLSCGPDTTAVSGEGGSTPFGTGGYHRIQISAGNTAGIAGNNYGSGGSGAAGCSSVADAAGGNGAGGFIRVWEYY